MEIKLHIDSVENGYRIWVAEESQGLCGRNYVALSPQQACDVLAEQFAVEVDRVMSEIVPPAFCLSPGVDRGDIA